MRQAIIIFQKNAVSGQVKTRLAASVGAEKAMEIYLFLCSYTHQILNGIPADKFLFYSESVEENHELKKVHFQVQQGIDLGERMFNAFEFVFRQGYGSALIIGTDCYEMNEGHIRKAFECLESSDYVFGPASDGGYYLLAAKKVHPEVFLKKSWSHDQVLNEAVHAVRALGLTYSCTETLSDIDEVDDLKELREKFGV